MADVTIAPITRLLIANRGEIARRIIRSAHDMGIATVAVYADGDAGAPFVRDADTAIALHGTSSAETYLDAAKVLEACQRSGADAVHPGYGFLSENTAFAQAVERAGIRWVGPSAEAIAAMGDKLAAKALMHEAGVPTLPAIELMSDTDFADAAKEIGYPVLVKAAAGGGGRGMRIVETEGQLAEAVEGARREAQAAFGDGTVFLERWLTAPRHVEIQILGDRHGNLVHLFERECSIQRRHQKIIEEAPSPAVDPDLRARMGEAAVSAAQKIGYSSAGTVEFLLDGGDFWFLEVNTRLQVEHPVTEEITGLDLVREQLRVAEGETLGYGQDDLAIDGHAIEARVYAEDPDNDFLPTGGTVLAWEEADGGRFDTGIETGSEVSIEFDPMIAKVIVHAPTRREAAGRLARVLEKTRLQGVTNNRDFLVATLREPAFLAGDTTTDFIDRVQPPRTRSPSTDELNDACIATALFGQAQRRAAATVLADIPSGWRNSLMPPQRTKFRWDDDEILVEYRAGRNDTFAVTIGEADSAVVVYDVNASDIDLEIDGRRVKASVTPRDNRWLVHGPGGDVELQELSRFPSNERAAIAGGLVAPMPGNVTAIHVAEGDTVEDGQLLLILEAMKMEHRITAPMAGAVKQLLVDQGDQVDNGALLVVLEEHEGSEKKGSERKG